MVRSAFCARQRGASCAGRRGTLDVSGPQARLVTRSESSPLRRRGPPVLGSPLPRCSLGADTLICQRTRLTVDVTIWCGISCFKDMMGR